MSEYKRVYLEITEDLDGMPCKVQRCKNMTEEEIKKVTSVFDDDTANLAILESEINLKEKQRERITELEAWQKRAVKLMQDISDCGYVLFDEDIKEIEQLIKEAEGENSIATDGKRYWLSGESISLNHVVEVLAKWIAKIDGSIAALSYEYPQFKDLSIEDQTLFREMARKELEK